MGSYVEKVIGGRGILFIVQMHLVWCGLVDAAMERIESILERCKKYYI